MIMCKYCFKKMNDRTKKEMYYCQLLMNEKNDLGRLCQFQRYCKNEKGYILNDPKRCRNFV